MFQKLLLSVFLLIGILPALAEDVIVLPRLKPTTPSQGPATLDSAVEEPQVKTNKRLAVRLPKGSGGWSAASVAAAESTCVRVLQALDMDYEPLGAIGNEGGCGAPRAILISSIAGVRIEPPAEANCAFAEALHHWISWSVKPAAEEHLKRKLVVVRNATAYACRRRNNAASGKMSEHAYVNALDISTLGFDDGSSTSIKGDWSGLTQLIGASRKSDFLRRIRRDACIRFTTVLGPGSDPYHGDHFHIDLSRRKSGYRICK